MCGINGIISLDKDTDWSAYVQKMNQRLSHRGPDDEGIYTQPGLALGHRRLSIIDLSAAGHQPMSDHTGRYTVVFNGEIYNYRELREELKNEYPFSTDTDTEVILAAYTKWNYNCVGRLNGMFAFAVWDNKEKETYVFRDRLGIKPVYIYYCKNTFAFSSELRAMLASGLMAPKIRPDALEDYLRYQTVHAPATIIDNVQMMLPGTYWRVRQFDTRLSPGELVKETGMWWMLPGPSRQVPSGYEEVRKNVRRLLTKAVERRLISDVPFGAFLSGGIDSSAVVALMSEVATEKIKTFSVVFDDSEFSEAKYARLIAEKFGTDHHEIKLSPEDFLHDLPAALDAMDHPSGDGPNTFVVSKATKQAGITMALSGLGGDELFAGYDIFRRVLKLQQNKWISSLPAGVRKFGGSVIKTLKPGVGGEKMAEVLALSKIDFKGMYPLSRRVLSDGQISSVMEGSLRGSRYVTEATRMAGSNEQYMITAISRAEIMTYMQNVLLRDTDQMSMSCALEVRVPFLDYELVEYVLGLPDQFKNPVTPKKLLVDALGELLPREIVDRPKMGFTFPWKNWMKKELRSFCEERLKRLGERNGFRASGIDAMWKQFLADDPRVTWSRIWPMVVLSHWLDKNNIDG